MKITVRQLSGLGNQLFQYAAGRYYAKRLGADISLIIDPERKAMSYGLHPRPFLLSHFRITAPVREITPLDQILLSTKSSMEFLSAPIKLARGIQVVRERVDHNYLFLPDLFVNDRTSLLYLAGYWQNYHMSGLITNELRSEFTFKEPAQGKNLEVLSKIQQTENPVSLHVRRGDYLRAEEGRIALPIDYYSHAISTIRERVKNPVFFVFSDDMAFVKENFPTDLQTIFVDHNDDLNSHEDLRLMAACRHHIIANSTFSWWGAWLNPRKDKIVVAPKFWRLKTNTYYPDLLPPDWILTETVPLQTA